MKYDVVFYVAYPYYYPHFLPIGKALNSAGLNVHYVLSTKQNTVLMETIAKEEQLSYSLGDELLETIETDVILFASVPSETLNTKAKKVFLCHGTGTKQCGFEKALERCDIVLVEGDYRYNYYTSQFPALSYKIKQVGYSKLDEIVNTASNDIVKLKEKYHINNTKKTILYAPTFFPSSIEKMSDTFPHDFKECNILVKPHYLTWERKRYATQRKKLQKWKQYDNCHIFDASEYNLIPFLIISDVMISDESSAIFEFASLNKPVIINKFLKLRWSYYLNPKKLFKRMDTNMNRYRVVGENPESYKEMLKVTKKTLEDSSDFEQARLTLAQDICGTIDGKVSERIVDVIKELRVK
ncbi:MAG: CDP-glycerol glycerophosphotransferase family protein [Campylobacterota bacterium]|nr:CDP-glycerol glycerophosphotransferase family protein [Campylobacterota bacterium]